jgi:hypothetical protein
MDLPALYETEYARLAKRIEFAATSGTGYGDRRSPPASHVLDVHTLIWKSDRDPLDVVLRRTEALLAHVRAMPGAPDLAAEARAVAAVRAEADKTPAGAANPRRKAVFLRLSEVRRRTALANPLLDFDEIIYSKGDGWSGLLHNAPSLQGRGWAGGGTKEHVLSFDYSRVPDGRDPRELPAPDPQGIFVARGIRTSAPVRRQLFLDAKIANGRWAGRRIAYLKGSTQFGFDLSWDGNTVVFAKNIVGPYHLFIGGVDGGDVTQLTASAVPDYEPCFLPNGRIAFVSLRRYLVARCSLGKGELCGTLFSIAPNGSDLYPISWHETSELYPTVDSDGRLVYTRWDYVDRDFAAAHNLWTCHADGRDPRAPHGNYPYPHSLQTPDADTTNRRSDRPFAEFHIRAVPGAPGLYVATATDHHGSGPGTPVLIDTRRPDDNGMSQVRIIVGASLKSEATPRSPIPPEAYFVTPWPLSADYFLVSDVERKTVDLLDRFGNAEPLLADADPKDRRDCPLAARPLGARPRPPMVPVATWQGERPGATDHRRATISIMNVYDSDKPWPDGTRITALRIVQIIDAPWCGTRAHRYAPGIAYAHGSNARMVLGTVPVEADGSAYFEAPVEREIYFQALDERGMAVQSMRSGTYVHPGEHLSCQGCHEDKWQAPSVRRVPLALRREPSKIAPDVDGSCPLTYARLVKPVFEKTCVPCHRKEGKGFQDTEYWKGWTPGKAHSGKPADFGPLVFYLHGDDAAAGSERYHGGYASDPGFIGARASRMGRALLATHKDRITPEQFHRVILWLDTNSMELGAYHDDEAQRAGEVVWPILCTDPKNPTGVERLRR